MSWNTNGLESLTREECLELLASVSLGRVVFTDRALPAIQPVAFALDGEDVVIHTRHGSKLDIALRQAVVAFEADDLNPATHNGWSVTLVGQVRPVADDHEAARSSALTPQPMDTSRRDLVIRIPATYITGHRVKVGDLAA